MSKQPEALRLADELEMWTLGEPAAAELRRLYAENRLLHERHAGDNEILHGLEQQRDELLATLKRIEMAANATVCNTKWIAEHAKAAIAKVEAGK